MTANLPRKIVCTICTAAMLGGQFGCASTDFKKDVTEQGASMQKGPENGPRTSDTTFADALRCMDNMFVTYNVRNLGMLVEDLIDNTKKVNAGTKDMFISAVSQMTRRSRGVRLLAYSPGTDGVLDVYIKTISNKALETLPQFATRGSISQFDESTVKEQGDGGINLGPFSIGVAKQASNSILGLDLSVIRTDDLSLVPGVTARNSVQIIKEGVGADGEVSFKKFGANFNYTLAKNEGQAQALRTLTELAAIELLGKLTRTPYWTCLGAPDTDRAVASEIRDWWENFVGEPQTLIVYFQNQMRARGLYSGDIDGQVNPPFIEAVRSYQQAMGMEGNANVNFEFFRRYLAADHAKVQIAAKGMLKQVAYTPPEPAQAAARAAAQRDKFAISVADPKGENRRYTRGELYSVEVQPAQDSFTYCYLIDEKRKVSQFFPNPVAPSAASKGGVKMRFPGTMPFRFVTNNLGIPETVACFAAARDLGANPLPNSATIGDIDGLRASLEKVAGPNLGMAVLNVKPQ